MTKPTDFHTYWKYKRQSVIDDCEKPGAIGYDRIGAKGIKLYPRWRQTRGGLRNFIDDIVASIGPRPSLEHGLSRLDGAKDFEPGNMAWLTQAGRSALRQFPTRDAGPAQHSGELADVSE